MTTIRRVLLAREILDPAAGPTNNDKFVPVAVGPDGTMWSMIVGSEAGVPRPVLVDFGDIDNITAVGNPAFITAMQVQSFMMGYDPVGNNWDRLRTVLDNADAQAVDVAFGRLAVLSRQQRFNGLTWDRERGNQDLTLLAAGVRAVTTNSADQTSHNARGLHVVFDITAVPGVDTVTLTIEGKDAVSGKYYQLISGDAEVAVGTRAYRVYPGIVSVAKLAVNDVLPRSWRVTVTHSGAGNFTYSVGASLIL